MAIKRETIEKIRTSSDVVEVVGDFVQLKRRGTVYIGLCPFHNEKTPSFNVNPVLGIYKCFGCGKAGDSISFMMEHQSMSYPEALRYLAEKYNIEVEETFTQSNESKLQQTERESILIAMKWAKQYFKNLLHEHPDGKGIGLSYFRERGFTDPTIEAFELGYALEGWDGLYSSAQKAGFSKDILEKAGLLVSREDGKVFDRFRGRVMFPIHDSMGRPIAFGARFLGTDKTQPKYLNSPETLVYKKSEVLYGLFQAKKSIREADNCYLCEGYTDVISLHQAGIKNVVASSGTALTPDQIKLISRHTKNITVLYDGDAAGIKASLRGIDLLLEGGMNVRAVAFPTGEDPDSYVREIGQLAFVEYLKDNAVDFIRFKAGLYLEEGRRDPIRKTAIVRDIVTSITKVQDALLRSEYYTMSATLLDVDEQILRSEGNRILQEAHKKQSQDEQNRQRQSRPSGSAETQGQAIARPAQPASPPPLQDFPGYEIGGGEPEDGYYFELPLDGAIPSEGGGPDLIAPPSDNIDDRYPPDDYGLDQGNQGYYLPTPAAELMEQPDLAGKAGKRLKLQAEHEREVLRFLLQHTTNGGSHALELAHYFQDELADVLFTDPVNERIYGFFSHELESGRLPSLAYFMAQEDREIANAVAGLVSTKVELSQNWYEKHRILINTEQDNIDDEAFRTVARLRLLLLRYRVYDLHEQIKQAADEEELTALAAAYIETKQQEVALANELGIVLTDFHSTRPGNG